jgi:hypothetical protein
MKRFPILLIALLAITGLAGCAGMSDTQQRTVTGGLGGTAGGALIGAIAGNAGMGLQLVQASESWVGICMTNTNKPKSGPMNKGEVMPYDSRVKPKKTV